MIKREQIQKHFAVEGSMYKHFEVQEREGEGTCWDLSHRHLSLFLSGKISRLSLLCHMFWEGDFPPQHEGWIMSIVITLTRNEFRVGV